MRNNQVSRVLRSDFPNQCDLQNINLEHNQITSLPYRAFYRCRASLDGEL